MLEQMLQKYKITTHEQALQAWREIMQEIALAGLYRGGFFNKAAFYGGTCLRIFYDLPRFSEDLDFSLLTRDDDFSLTHYFSALEEEFNALGIEVVISQKNKTKQTQIESAFLKNTTQIFDIALQGSQTIKIKFEVDTSPPLHFETQEKLLLEPLSFYVKCFSIDSLFAGKMHALLFRKWGNRVKGRDWFDFEWYVRKRACLNLAHFNQRALESGDIKLAVDEEGFKKLLKHRISTVDFKNARLDVERFIPDSNVLNIWSADYFLAVSEKVRIA